MSTRRTVTVWASALIFAGGFIGWRQYAIRHADPPAYVALVHDDSDSDGVGCAAVRSVVTGLFKLSGVAAGSQLALISTGDKENGYDGKLVRTFDLPFTTRVMEGKEAQLRRRNELGDSVQKTCEALPQRGQSPILRGVKDAVDHLRANHCGPAAACFLYVVTDGEETVDGVLRAALNGSRSALKRLKGTVSNEGIQVSFCGFAQTRLASGHSGSAYRRTSAEQLKEVWTTVFTQPSLVNVAPYCRD